MKNNHKCLDGNRLTLLLLNEKTYLKKLAALVKEAEHDENQICYVCLNKPYEYVVEDMQTIGMRPEKFFFLDVMSSHYGTPEPRKGCVFLLNDYNLDDIHSEVSDAVSRKGCNTVVFDDVTKMLNYHQAFSILHFTNRLVSDKKTVNAKKLFIIFTDDDPVKSLVDDLTMLADRRLEFNSQRGAVDNIKSLEKKNNPYEKENTRC